MMEWKNGLDWFDKGITHNYQLVEGEDSRPLLVTKVMDSQKAFYSIGNNPFYIQFPDDIEKQIFEYDADIELMIKKEAIQMLKNFYQEEIDKLQSKLMYIEGV